MPHSITQRRGRQIWIAAQKLDQFEPFGSGPAASLAAIAHLGYVQIDTINVIERCHHHILWSRIPRYERSDLTHLQSGEKSIAEYWTHALSYLPAAEMGFFHPMMKRFRQGERPWFGSVTPEEVRAMLKRLRADGPLSIRDIGDDALVDKTHLWGSRKPSKRVLELMFYQGLVTISARQGMLKTYDLYERHFGAAAKPATERQVIAYKLDRALRAQGLVSVDSICHLDAPSKKAVRELIEARVKRRQLVPVSIEGCGKIEHWATPETLETPARDAPGPVHILSPFDPLVIQRKRLKLFFDYEHLFEAYLPAAKRQFGYFALPILRNDSIVAVYDLKTDRAQGKLLIQKASWLAEPDGEAKTAVEDALGRFEAFQLGRTADA